MNLLYYFYNNNLLIHKWLIIYSAKFFLIKLLKLFLYQIKNINYLISHIIFKK